MLLRCFEAKKLLRNTKRYPSSEKSQKHPEKDLGNPQISSRPSAKYLLVILGGYITKNGAATSTIKKDRTLREEKVLEILVDVSEQPTQKPEKKQKQYYSGEKQGNNLKIEIVIDQKCKKVTRPLHDPISIVNRFAEGLMLLYAALLYALMAIR
eukprot:gene3027-3782_t